MRSIQNFQVITDIPRMLPVGADNSAFLSYPEAGAAVFVTTSAHVRASPCPGGQLGSNFLAFGHTPPVVTTRDHWPQNIMPAVGGVDIAGS